MKIRSHIIFSILPLGTLALAFSLLCGCAVQHHAYLVPAPSDNLANGGNAATASADGVTIRVTPNDWNGQPHDLYNHVTPLQVRIENHTKRPLRVAYQDFQIETPQGNTLAALPPSQIRGSAYSDNLGTRQTGNSGQFAGSSEPFAAHFVETAWQSEQHHHFHFHSQDSDRTTVVITPGFDYDDFYYAPYWGYGYVGIGAWPYWWGPDIGYYQTYDPYMRAYNLPTRSMLRKGLPEGVIAPGGYVQGFLYFSKVNPRLTQVTFVAKLQGAKTGQQFGTIRVPFQVTEITG